MSEHPLATAIVRGAEEQGIATVDVANFRSVTGKGVLGAVGERQVAIGTVQLLSDLGADASSLVTAANDLRTRGETVMFVAVDGVAAGLISVADPVKATTADAIRALHDEGLRVVMVTGDSRITAEAVARAVGIDQVEAEVLPEGKVAAVTAAAGAGAPGRDGGGRHQRRPGARAGRRGDCDGYRHGHRDGERGHHARSG